MAIRTTIVNKTKNADGTYTEKEIHPFTDMNAVVSLEPVSGNYDKYTNLPLEGAPQNALTAFLNTRSYLYSLRNFKNKTVTNNYTETTNLTTKVPSMEALKNAYDDCKSMALDGAYRLYAQSLVNNLVISILNAPLRYLSPIYFNDNIEVPVNERNYVLKPDMKSEIFLNKFSVGVDEYVPFVNLYKLTFFENDNSGENLNKLLRDAEYNINDLYRGRYYDYGYNGKNSLYIPTYYFSQIFNPSYVRIPEMHEEIIIAVVIQKADIPKIGILYRNRLIASSASPFIRVDVDTHDNPRLILNGAPESGALNKYYTIEYCNMRIDGDFALILKDAMDCLNI